LFIRQRNTSISATANIRILITTYRKNSATPFSSAGAAMARMRMTKTVSGLRCTNPTRAFMIAVRKFIAI